MIECDESDKDILVHSISFDGGVPLSEDMHGMFIFLILFNNNSINIKNHNQTLAHDIWSAMYSVS